MLNLEMATTCGENTLTTTTSRTIAVIGSGPVGVALAKQLVKAGHSVTISNSRSPDTLGRQAQETGAKPLDTRDAITNAEIVVIGTPVASIPSLSRILQGSQQSGKIIIDTCNYYPSRDGRIESLDKGMPDSAWVAQHFSAPVVKAFNSIIAADIVTSAKAKGSPKRVTLPVSGDDDTALRAVMGLVEEIGFDAYNAGPLFDSWRYQPGQPAYCTEPTLGQLLSLLAKANRTQGPIDRDKARAMFEKLPDNYPPQILLRLARLSAGLDRWSLRSWLSAMAFVFAVARGTVRSHFAS